MSPVDGYLNDRAPRAGEYVAAGRPVLSVVDMHSFRVDGYFEETKLRGIDIGQPVDIEVMGEPGVLRGHVQSIVAGIEDRDRTQGTNLLPNVNPAFSWVRLAQRIPVRIALDEVPADFRMIAGRTATVSVRGLRAFAGFGRRGASARRRVLRPLPRRFGRFDRCSGRLRRLCSRRRKSSDESAACPHPDAAARSSARSPRASRSAPTTTLPQDAAINAPLANTPLEGAGRNVVSPQTVPPYWWRLVRRSRARTASCDDALQSNTDLRVAAANLARSREALGVAEAQGGFSGGASAAVERAQESGEQFLIFEKLPVGERRRHRHQRVV